MEMMNKNNLPRGIRNNNPANILRSGSHWIGLSLVQSDKRFCKFTDMVFGVRAFFVLARTYRKKYGIKSVRRFIERFAPFTENDVESYFSFITYKSNLFNLNNDYDYSTLLYWVIRYENGLSSLDMKKLGLCSSNLDNIRKKFNINIC